MGDVFLESAIGKARIILNVARQHERAAGNIPASWPVSRDVERLARVAWTAAVQPAGPEPMVMMSYW